MSQTKNQEKIELKAFINAYVEAQKKGKTVVDLCNSLGIDPKQYASYRNRMTKMAEKANVEIKPLARKERSPNASTAELRDLLLEAFGEKTE